ncbi:hypothetical protein G7Z17_g3941 [Cylindrodendrum hubeiense]|uniref:Uncharacterized protein n=1 Tax=Cylindrodendrum hubeiense TaxID=595255 RepID=A0A9P5HHU2_9HYPO|nr:hypothetical protein G7Z17_g3941 [Cylindrodendrum hubeiense]
MFILLVQCLLFASRVVVFGLELTHTSSCDLYFTDFDSAVNHVYKKQKLKWDSSLTKCDLPLDSENTLHATCNSKLQSFPFASFTVDGYFCVCHGRPLYVPNDIYCDTRCYPDLKKSFNQCNWMEFYYSGFKDNLNDMAILCDSCNKFSCDDKGTRCAANINTWLCDNKEHEVPYQDLEPGKSYVCNCHGPATIPKMYRSLTLGKSGGIGCKKKRATCNPFVGECLEVVADNRETRTTVIRTFEHGNGEDVAKDEHACHFLVPVPTH